MSDTNDQQDTDPALVDPEGSLDSLVQQVYSDDTMVAAEGRRLLDSLNEHSVLFAPVSDCHFTPLHRFTHLIDVFIFCGWQFTDTDVEDLIRESQGFASMGLGVARQVLPGLRADRDPAVMEDFGDLGGLPLIFDARRPEAFEPFIRVVQLCRRVGGRATRVWFVAIGGNPLNVYHHLFQNRGIAPKMLWLPWPLGVPQGDWLDFIATDGPLGGLFAPGNAQPDLVASRNYMQGWQQNILFQECPMPAPGFDVVINALPGLGQAARPAAIVPAGARQIKISSTPIHPSKIADDELVVLTEREYRHYQWPAQRVLISTNQVQAAQQQAQPRLPNLPLRGQPMKRALGLLDIYCQANGIKRVAASRLGYEDEGPYLDECRQKAGPIEKITFHCEADGDVVSLGGYGEND